MVFRATKAVVAIAEEVGSGVYGGKGGEQCTKEW